MEMFGDDSRRADHKGSSNLTGQRLGLFRVLETAASASASSKSPADVQRLLIRDLSSPNSSIESAELDLIAGDSKVVLARKSDVTVRRKFWAAMTAALKHRLLLLHPNANLTLTPSLSELSSNDLVFVTSAFDQNCHEACAENGEEWQCSSPWFDLLNRCDLLQVAFPHAATCLSHFYGRDLPALSSDVGGYARGDYVLVNSKPQEYDISCDAQGEHSARLCACKRSGTGGRDLQSRVSRIVIKQLQQFDKRLAGGQQAAGQANEWWAERSAQSLIEDIEKKRTTFLEANQGVSCFTACQEQNLACQRIWFDVLNNCEALAVAFPSHKICSTDFYGRDLPAYRPEDLTVLVNKKPRTYSSSCGGKHEKTKRLCGCGFSKGGSTTSRTFHTVYNVQASKYFEWQVRYMHFWFKQANMPGKITRLLSANQPDFLAGEIPTHTSPPYKSDDPNDHYTPYNKPWAIHRWLQDAEPTEDVILIVDPDCMFLSRMEFMVEEGAPVAQQAFYHFDFSTDDVPMQIARRYCRNCSFLDPIAVPIIIHRHDIARIAPLWLKKTREIRIDKPNWPISWYNTSMSPVGLTWTAEMFGYVFAAAELGIRHEIWDLQNVPRVHKEIFTSIIHYHVEVPIPDGTRNSRDTKHEWKTVNKYVPEVRRR
ncbi:hypothetical protein GUITHDRAFT_116905 [Guillardia theta CCMP2712]|uniref:Uncharacterized protein n=1 Tax=Guillardia theta (strain CCMP2712) TaxID=905079 RepID=L1IL92_GUITC|nr:hypothetical protein GUITHDRAFT_116905 [Guillardia theta CCMP2712]EKX36882.1 hypothetical protein GUITHDRAFT_116905 [Guillardia theta CCMP2712]|eukprot:XP_005823862.1 hypothetical protein GUITHDRAFT_116905 [Guillardia theta CCMP2712]